MSVELDIKRGSTFIQTLSCVDDLDQAIDLSTWLAFESDLKLKASGETLLSFTVDTTDAATGVLVLNATSTETLNLPPSMTLVFDVKFTDPSGDIHYSEDIELITSKHITH